MDDAVAQFTSITSADPQRAAQYLRVSDGNLERAIQLYFESGGVDMGAALPSTDTGIGGGASSARNNAEDPITVDSDDEEGNRALRNADTSSTAAVAGGNAVEDDEAMARRLQEEMYGPGGGGGGAGGLGNAADGEGVSAPIGRQAETLSGPYAAWRDAPQDMEAAIAEQMLARHARQSGSTSH